MMTLVVWVSSSRNNSKKNYVDHDHDNGNNGNKFIIIWNNINNNISNGDYTFQYIAKLRIQFSNSNSRLETSNSMEKIFRIDICSTT